MLSGIGSSAVAQSGSRGAVVGTVSDAETGKAISGAGVEELDTNIRVGTEADGSFRLELDPGAYELRVVAPFYRSREVPNVVVTGGVDTSVDVRLEPSAAGEIELLEVVADAYGGSEASQLLDRKLAPTLSDNISAQMIKLSPDSDAAEIVQRVPAVTIQDDKYLNVRGLNERYTSALVNSSRLPSTDPLRRAVPLDLFPAGFIESISIVKTYTPDLPGDFSGGLADIKLKPYPDEFTLDLGVSTKANTSTTFQDFRTYDGGGAQDWFGYGEDFRALPGLIPEDTVRPPQSSRQRAFASSFRNIWDTEPTTAAPGYSIGLSTGGKLVDNLGTALGISYGTDWEYRDDEVANTFVAGAGDQPVPFDSFVYARSVFETTFGIVSSTGLEIAEGHEVNFRGIYNRESDDEVLDGTGEPGNQQGSPVRARFLTYTANELGWGQFSGANRFDWLAVDWRTALSRTMQDSPDNRYEVRNIEPDGTTEWTNISNSGRRVFSNLEEYLTDSAVDLKVPFRTRLPFTDVWSGHDASLKFGPAYLFREREHALRNFRYDAGGNLIPRSLPTEEFLDPENIFPGGNTFREETQPRDSFKGRHEIAALYGMLEAPILSGWEDEDGQLRHQLRLIGGVRGEYSYIVVETFGNTGQPIKPILNDLDALPGVNLVYSPVEDVNLRFGWSRAVSRPELRELSPVLFPAKAGLRPVAGNEDLVSASIESFDLRAEWFLGAAEVLSFGVFYKELEDPIEAALLSQGSGVTDTFANAESATLVGFEIEARAELNRLSNYLDGFSFSTNITYADSQAKLGDVAGEGTVTTSDERELQGQAPFIVNAALDYTHDDWGTARVLYNTIGERLSTVGANRLPDIFEQRRDQLDFVYLTEINPFGTPLNAKFAVENILNDEYEFLQADETTQKWKTGVSFSFGLSYSY
jgi:hypothetical protein